MDTPVKSSTTTGSGHHHGVMVVDADRPQTASSSTAAGPVAYNRETEGKKLLLESFLRTNESLVALKSAQQAAQQDAPSPAVNKDHLSSSSSATCTQPQLMLKKQRAATVETGTVATTRESGMRFTNIKLYLEFSCEKKKMEYNFV
jgi:hypothetical protein